MQSSTFLSLKLISCIFLLTFIMLKPLQLNAAVQVANPTPVINNGKPIVLARHGRRGRWYRHRGRRNTAIAVGVGAALLGAAIANQGPGYHGGEAYWTRWYRIRYRGMYCKRKCLRDAYTHEVIRCKIRYCRH